MRVKVDYREKRRPEYPPIEEQLDAIWKGGAEMEAMRPRFAEIVDGYSSHWDGSNTRARWTDEAVRAIDIAGRETFEYPEDLCDGECAVCWPEDES
mgnify:CR=1 FL=1